MEALQIKVKEHIAMLDGLLGAGKPVLYYMDGKIYTSDPRLEEKANEDCAG